jgi:hypothetical protein
MEIPDAISLRRDAVAKLADGDLRRQIEADLVDPKLTVREVWLKHELDCVDTGHHIPLSTLEKCAIDRRAVLAQHHQRALIQSIRNRMDEARGIEMEVGKLQDAALAMATRNVVDAMLEAEAPLETVAALVEIQKGLALANWRAGSEQRKREEWETKKASIAAEVNKAAGGSPDGKVEAGKVIDLIDRIMRGEEAA